MEVQVFETIKEGVDVLCREKPLKMVGMKFTPKTPISDYLKNIMRRYPMDLGNAESKFSRYQSQVLYAILHGWVFDKEIAKKFNLRLEDIEERYTKHTHYWNYLKGREDYNAFRDYIYNKAEQFYEIEKVKCLAFTESKLLNQLVGIPPILYSNKRLSQANRTLAEYGKKIEDAKDELMKGSIDHDEYDEVYKSSKLDSRTHRSTIVFELSRLRRHSHKEEQEYFLAKCVPSNIEWGGNPPLDRPLYAGTVSKVEGLIREYTRWFKREYNIEIESTRQEKRNENARKLYDKSVESDRQKKRAIEKQNRVAVFDLYMSGVTGLRNISQTTGLSYYMVRKVVDQIKSLISED